MIHTKHNKQQQTKGENSMGNSRMSLDKVIECPLCGAAMYYNASDIAELIVSVFNSDHDGMLTCKSCHDDFGFDDISRVRSARLTKTSRTRIDTNRPGSTGLASCPNCGELNPATDPICCGCGINVPE